MRRLLISFLLLFLFTALFSAQAQTVESGNTEVMRGFARAVTVADGSVFIGEPANVHQPGMVYIYNKSDADWSEQAQLMASDGEIGDGFGSALSADGSRVLIGAPEAADESGAAYIFDRTSDGSWTETSRLVLSDKSAEDGFGESVALHGDFAFIGAPEEEDDFGGVYVFQQTDEGSWTQQAYFANPDTSKGMNFGSALAVDGTRLLVGSPQDKGGAVYIYQSNDEGAWTKKATLESDGVGEDAGFGSSIGLHGDQVLISAPGHASGSGAVFVFQRDGDAQKWNARGRLVAYDSEPRYLFGSSLAFAGTDVWIGAPNADNGKGAIYQFEQNQSGNEWTGVKKINGPDREQNDQFAGTIAVDDNIAVAGLVGADYGAGTAAILERDGDTGSWSVQATVLGKGSSVLKPIMGGKVECADGKADRFGCNNVNLISFLPIEEIGGDRGVRLNDMWGWTDPQTGKEYALVGRNEGTSFVDVSDPYNPVYVGTLPKPDSARASVWRDIKIYENHAFIVADNAGPHGMQVVDLTNLRDFEGTPIALEEVAHYDEINSAHNVVINTDISFAFIVGSSGGGQTCGGGLHMVNIQDPTNPTFAGCFADPSTGRSGTGYTHDAQCVIYQGPDEEYQGREICVGSNETAISIADVTDKENPKAVSTASYPDYGYVHQGWFTENHRYFFQNDELDELSGTVDQTRTLVWDVTDLDDPQLVREFMLDNPASDHNLYIKNNTMYQSNYVSGLQVIDISDPENPVKTGYFDTHPFGEDQPGFAGTWSNYPFFDSGIVVMTSSREGLFILETQEREL
jgi:choice-of-anchor B domain-containing protein